MLGGATDSAIAADRVLGLLAQTMGDLGQAAGHFEDALAFCRKAVYRPELAWTCCDYADTLLERVGVPLLDVGAKRLDPRPIGRSTFLLVAPTPKDLRARAPA